MEKTYNRVALFNKLSSAIRNEKHNVESVLHANTLINTIQLPIIEPEIRVAPSGRIEFLWWIEDKFKVSVIIQEDGVLSFSSVFSNGSLISGKEPKKDDDDHNRFSYSLWDQGVISELMRKVEIAVEAIKEERK